ncbi:MAG: chalcone isomerase family protein [Rubrivivax sp.]|nr:chalcone isomerase family protein [Rubrivivax sp.]
MHRRFLLAVAGSLLVLAGGRAQAQASPASAAATPAAPAALAAPPATSALAPPAEVATELPGPRLQGRGVLRFLGLRVYDVRLWTGAAPLTADFAAVPLALEFEYARGLSGSKIAERSLQEMRRQGELPSADAERWLSAMRQLFPDVRAGDRITAVLVPAMGVRFFINSRLKGDIRDPQFARLFIGIWLSPQTSEPALREALLGKPA